MLCALRALRAPGRVDGDPRGDGPWGLELLALAFGGLGFSAIPLMPISFEAAVMVSQAGEGTLAGLCMSGGQLLGIGRMFHTWPVIMPTFPAIFFFIVVVLVRVIYIFTSP